MLFVFIHDCTLLYHRDTYSSLSTFRYLSVTCRESPRPERKALEVCNLRLDVPHECGQAKRNAEQIHGIIAVPLHFANASSILTPLLLGLNSA